MKIPFMEMGVSSSRFDRSEFNISNLKNQRNFRHISEEASKYHKKMLNL